VTCDFFLQARSCHAEEDTEETLMADDDDGGVAGGDAANGRDAQGANLRGEM